MQGAHGRRRSVAILVNCEEIDANRVMVDGMLKDRLGHCTVDMGHAFACLEGNNKSCRNRQWLWLSFW